MFMVRAISLARLLSREIAEPERILSRLNDELAADNPSGMFVTFLCGVYQPASRRLALANAGHCRPVLLGADGTPRWAVKDLGTALGFEGNLKFDRTDLVVQQGARQEQAKSAGQWLSGEIDNLRKKVADVGIVVHDEKVSAGRKNSGARQAVDEGGDLDRLHQVVESAQ